MLKTDKSIIFLLTVLFFALLPFFFLHQGLLLIDTGREFYIPSQMLNGSVLFKDIYNIYGALSYQFNALLFLIFGQKFTTLYIAGIFNSFIITITLYLLAREFLNKSISFLFTALMIFALVYNTFLYNSNLTYCFAIVYALSSFLLSALFLIKYIKSNNKLLAYLSCFFAGISIANKYEFVFYLFVILYAIIFVKPIGLKGFFKSLTAFLIIPCFSLLILLVQGLNINDIKENTILLYKLISAPALKLFFAKFRVFFDNKIFAIFGILPVLNLILTCLNFKKIYNDKPLFIILLIAITASAKSFLFLNVCHMGIFIFPICALATVILFDKNKYLSIILFACILLFACEDFSSLQYKNYKLNTTKGSIYTFKKDGELIKYTSDFILANTKPNDRVTVLPEGCIINFITNRNGDNFYYNLNPLFYNDVFGDDKTINHFEQNLTEYIVLLPINNIEYGKSFFGVDYAQNFYKMINNNYKLIKEEKEIKIYEANSID